MPRVTIRPADTSSEDELRTAWAVVEAAQRAGRPYAVVEAVQARLPLWREPRRTYAEELLVAVAGGEPVGVAVVGRHLVDNSHLADLEVDVLPGHRRRGVGTALARRALARLEAVGCTTQLCEVNVAVGTPAAGGLAFADSLGFEVVHTEDHLVLGLPADPPRPRLHAGDDVVSWVDRCPEEHLEAYCAMRTQMDRDVPLGQVDLEPTVHTPQRQREAEERMRPSYTSLVAAARRGDELVGYSVVFLPRGESFAWQDDTLVMPDHRGRGLGAALKHATLDLLRRDHPERTIMHTWTDPQNEAMHRTNRRFGFEVVERMYEVQRIRTGRARQLGVPRGS